VSWTPKYSEAEVRAAVESSRSVAETLRKLSLRAAGHNPRTVKRLIAHYGISTAHFDPGLARAFPPRPAKPLEEILVRDSTYHRGHLKRRLYEAGVKHRECELCGQGEAWRGATMALILDHINGVPTDNRLENLRIVCPNCAATLDTHCGRNRALESGPRICAHCGGEFWPKHAQNRYCSRECGVHSRPAPGPRPDTRRVTRPPHEQLLRELAESNFCAVARRYGVSDNAVRKWLRAYEREARPDDG
jgi:hypothetical protein